MYADRYRKEKAGPLQSRSIMKKKSKRKTGSCENIKA